MNMRDQFRRPEWMVDWKMFILFAVISFTIAFAFRCVDLPKWDNPQFSVNGEYIMGTHDAYFWLAGAKRIGSAANNPMADMVRVIGSFTGAQYGNIAFWLPAVFAGLTAVAAFAWGMLIGGPWAGLSSAVLAANAPGFYYRTRLSFYDTDIVILLFPLLISVLLARWLLLFGDNIWKKKPDKKKIEHRPFEYLIPLSAGLLTNYGILWHGHIRTFGVMFLLVALGLGFILIHKSNRVMFLRGLVVYVMSAFWGGGGVVAAFLCVFFASNKRIDRISLFRSQWFYLFAIILITVFGVGGIGFLLAIKIKILDYLKPVAGSVTSSGVAYPGIAQSVIEAQNVPIEHILLMLSGTPWLSVLGGICFVGLICLRPVCLFLVPFALFAVLSYYMGGRFVMFGSIVIGLGIYSFLVILTQRIRTISVSNKYLAPAVCLVLLTVFAIPVYPDVKITTVMPIMGRDHAKALIEAGKNTPKDSMFWTWWDWGYATNYYAERRSFADGGNHLGKTLFPLALSFSSPSPLQASQVIKFSAQNKYLPSSVWDKIGAKNTMQQVLSLGTNKYQFPQLPKQYLVVTWENIRLAYWILYYGSWNVETKMAIHPSVTSIENPFAVNSETGSIDIKNEGVFRLASASVLDKNKSQFQKYDNSFAPNLMFNRMINRGYLVDSFTFNSMLVQLLIGDPSREQYRHNFRLVYDGFPNVRVFEIL